MPVPWPGPPAGTNRRREHSGGGARSQIEGLVSTVIENLLARKQKLVELLEKAQAVEERDRIEHQLEQINTALDFLDRPGSKGAR